MGAVAGVFGWTRLVASSARVELAASRFIKFQSQEVPGRNPIASRFGFQPTARSMFVSACPFLQVPIPAASDPGVSVRCSHDGGGTWASVAAMFF